MPITEAREILYTFRHAYPKIKLASNLAMNEVRRHGCVTSYAGRKRWFGDWEEDYKAFNQEVQMDVAEVMRDAMLGLNQAYPGSMRLQIHDSIVVAVPKRQGRRGASLREMEELINSFDGSVSAALIQSARKEVENLKRLIAVFSPKRKRIEGAKK